MENAQTEDQPGNIRAAVQLPVLRPDDDSSDDDTADFNGQSISRQRSCGGRDKKRKKCKQRATRDSACQTEEPITAELEEPERGAEQPGLATPDTRFGEGDKQSVGKQLTRPG